MPAVRAALLPHPPLLVPDLAGGAAAELDPLRSACRQALRSVLAASRAVLILGDGPVWGLARPGAFGSFAPYGADLKAGLPGSPLPLDLRGLPEPARLDELPLSLAVAAWLLGSPDAQADQAPGGAVHGLGAPDAPADQAPSAAVGGPGAAVGRPGAAVGRPGAAVGRPGVTVGGPGVTVGGAAATPAQTPPTAVPAEFTAVDPSSTVELHLAEVTIPSALALAGVTIPSALGPGAAVTIGRELARAASRFGPVGVVAMADLSARRSAKAPGALHPAAAGFDAAVARAVAAGDLHALATLDPGLAGTLMVAGRAVLQALAGTMDGAGQLHGGVLYDDAPYGVGYVVAVLTARTGAGRRAAPPPPR
jgi:hypothetical protein